MPGIPKSRGCQVCKQRKIKCDETWPTCVQCKLRRRKCPGPTELVKFINNASPPDEYSDCLQTRFSVMDVESPQPDSSHPSFRMRKIFYPKVGDSAAEYGLLRVGPPKTNPTTLADRVGLRLITSMQQGSRGLTSVHMSYLPELPKRLSKSACLRDSVDLFCAAWSDSRRQRRQRELMGMPQYGKVLRSLRRALLASQICSVETLAAMTLLERTSRLFDRGRHADLHLNGIRETLLKRGLPKFDDPLEIAVTNEIHGLLLRHPSGSVENDFIRESPWKEAFDRCADEQASTSDVRPFLINDMLLLYEYTSQLAPLFTDFGRLSSDPFSQKMTHLAVSIRRRLQDMKDSVRKIPPGPLKEETGDEAIKEAFDKCSLIGKEFYFKSILLAAMYQRMLICGWVPLRMVYEMSIIYGTPDSEIFAEFREASIGIWNVIPCLRALESIMVVDMLHPACMSHETVTEGKGYITESDKEIDSSVAQFPQDRKALNCAIIEQDRLLTGGMVVVHPV